MAGQAEISERFATEDEVDGLITGVGEGFVRVAGLKLDKAGMESLIDTLSALKDVMDMARQGHLAEDAVPVGVTTTPDAPIGESWLVVREVISATNSGAQVMSGLPGMVRRLLDEDAWREFPAPGGKLVRHATFTEFLEASPPYGLGGKRSQLHALCGADPDVIDRIGRMLAEDRAPDGVDTAPLDGHPVTRQVVMPELTDGQRRVYQAGAALHRNGANPMGALELLAAITEDRTWEKVCDPKGRSFAGRFREFVEARPPVGLGYDITELAKVIRLRHPHEGVPRIAEEMAAMREAVTRLLGLPDTCITCGQYKDDVTTMADAIAPKVVMPEWWTQNEGDGLTIRGCHATVKPTYATSRTVREKVVTTEATTDVYANQLVRTAEDGTVTADEHRIVVDGVPDGDGECYGYTLAEARNLIVALQQVVAAVEADIEGHASQSA